MSRGGRGGGFGAGAQNKLPFDVDPALEADIYNYDAEAGEKKEVDLNALFPVSYQ